MSSSEIASDLTIEASVEEVWALTVDVEGWPATTPTMTSVERLDEGPIGVGSQARVKQPRQRPTVWTVTRCEAPHTFEWETTILGVTMVGAHHLVPLDDHQVRNELRLRLSGFGSGLLRLLVGRTMGRAIETENQGFKRAAEATHRAAS